VTKQSCKNTTIDSGLLTYYVEEYPYRKRNCRLKWMLKRCLTTS